MMVGDQSGAIHLWDLRTDYNEQVVLFLSEYYNVFACFSY